MMRRRPSLRADTLQPSVRRRGVTPCPARDLRDVRAARGERRRSGSDRPVQTPRRAWMPPTDRCLTAGFARTNPPMHGTCQEAGAERARRAGRWPGVRGSCAPPSGRGGMTSAPVIEQHRPGSVDGGAGWGAGALWTPGRLRSHAQVRRRRGPASPLTAHMEPGDRPRRPRRSMIANIRSSGARGDRRVTPMSLR
jgi:hypothetical protein